MTTFPHVSSNGNVSPMAKLVLGPLLRHVNSTSATVWVETDAPCRVDVAGHTAETFRVGDQHFALVLVEGLEPGSSTEYQVRLDGAPVWPEPDSPFPAPRIRTLDERGDTFRLAFGSCRAAKPVLPAERDNLGPDALDAYAGRIAGLPESRWPDALLLLGDQVYADEPTTETKRWLHRRRRHGYDPADEVVHFREYAQLYHESWTDPEIRWLMSTVPTSMIFDDHDVRDDWNTSQVWREQMAAKPWWRARIRAGLASYWVYQHLGNLGPDELEGNEVYVKVRSLGPDEDALPLLEDFAEQADAEVDGKKSAWWSYRRDFGRVRLLVMDTRCGRILSGPTRLMMSDDEFEWIERNVNGDFDHLLLGSSLPWLMPHGLSHLQSLNEHGAGQPGVRGRLAERVRQAADLEHWPAFRASFDRLSRLIRRAADGERDGHAPSSVCVLSGDVHHSYVAQAHYPEPTRAEVFQLTCSPVHNEPPDVFKPAFRLAWSRPLARLLRRWADRAGIPVDPMSWTKLSGPHFGNALGVLEVAGRRADFRLESAARDGHGFVETAHLRLTPP
jgi:hypothetical protein